MSEMPGHRRPVPGPQTKYPVLHKKILVEHKSEKNLNFLLKVYFLGQNRLKWNCQIWMYYYTEGSLNAGLGI